MGDEKSIFQQSCLDDDFDMESDMESDEENDYVTDLKREQMTFDEINIIPDAILLKKNKSMHQNNLTQALFDN